MKVNQHILSLLKIRDALAAYRSFQHAVIKLEEKDLKELDDFICFLQSSRSGTEFSANCWLELRDAIWELLKLAEKYY